MKKLKICILLGAGLVLSNCGGEIHKTSALGPYNLLSIDARQRLVLAGKDPFGSDVICAEPSPDALSAQAATFGAVASSPTTAGEVKAKLAGSVSEAAATIGLRTQTIQLMRDGYFRLCEALINGQIGHDEYKGIVANIDSFMIAMLAIDTLGGTARAPAVSIGVESSVKDGNGVPETSAGVLPPNIEKIKADTRVFNKANTKAIEAIAKSYIIHSQRGRNGK